MTFKIITELIILNSNYFFIKVKLIKNKKQLICKKFTMKSEKNFLLEVLIYEICYQIRKKMNLI